MLEIIFVVRVFAKLVLGGLLVGLVWIRLIIL